MSTHPIHQDAISDGLRSRLQAFIQVDFVASIPKPPKKAHAVLWLDDWGRGVELAEACLEQVFTAYPLEHKVQVKLVRIALDEVDIRSETLNDLEGSALSYLVSFVDNITLTGDLDYTQEGDLEEWADETEPA